MQPATRLKTRVCQKRPSLSVSYHLLVRNRTRRCCAGKEGAAEPGTLSPDHPLKSLEQSLSQLDPFTHAAEPLTAAPVEPPAAAAAPLKKGPSRLGMKLRGSSFEAFEDVAVPPDAGHLNVPDGASGGPTAEQGREGATAKSKGKGPRHRRTTR